MFKNLRSGICDPLKIEITKTKPKSDQRGTQAFRMIYATSMEESIESLEVLAQSGSTTKSVQEKTSSLKLQTFTQNTSSYPIYSPQKPLSNVKTASSRLFDSKEQQRKIKEREEERKRSELKNCTFTPKINHNRKKIASKVFDRLASASRKQKLQNLEEKRAESELKNCTFKPNLSKKMPKTSAKSKVWDRLSRKKDDPKTLAQLKLEIELKDCTFQPKISSLSSLNSNSGNASAAVVWDRLSGDKEERKRREEERLKRKAQAEMQECTFDARKTVKNIRKKQHDEQEQRRLERLQLQANGPKSLEVGPSCFEQAFRFMRLSSSAIADVPQQQKNIKDQQHDPVPVPDENVAENANTMQ